MVVVLFLWFGSHLPQVKFGGECYFLLVAEKVDRGGCVLDLNLLFSRVDLLIFWSTKRQSLVADIVCFFVAHFFFIKKLTPCRDSNFYSKKKLLGVKF